MLEVAVEGNLYLRLLLLQLYGNFTHGNEDFVISPIKTFQFMLQFEFIRPYALIYFTYLQGCTGNFILKHLFLDTCINPCLLLFSMVAHCPVRTINAFFYF